MAFQILPLIELNKVINSLSKTIINLAIAIVIFLIGFIAGNILGKILYKMLEEIEINKFIKKSTGLRINVSQLLSNILAYFIYFLSLVAALEQIGLANIILYLLSGAVILILLISFFLAIRDFIPNLISGIYLYSKENLKEGYNINVNDIEGTLLGIDLFQTKIKTKKGDIIYLPNSLVATSKIKIKIKKFKSKKS